MLLIPSFFKGRAGRAVSSSEAVQMVNQKDAILIDLRSADQFKAGAIAQSRNIPAADLDAKAGTLPKDKPVILVCDTGRSAPRSVAVLRKHGINGFYDSVELRKACCGMRKVEPLKRALAGKRAWGTPLLERSFTIPILRRDVGLDAIAGLVPVLGDVLTAAMVAVGLSLHSCTRWISRLAWRGACKSTPNCDNAAAASIAIRPASISSSICMVGVMTDAGPYYNEAAI